MRVGVPEAVHGMETRPPGIGGRNTALVVCKSAPAESASRCRRARGRGPVPRADGRCGSEFRAVVRLWSMRLLSASVLPRSRGPVATLCELEAGKL